MFKNIKIGMRLSLGFGTLLILMSVVGGYGILQIKELNSEINVLVDDRMVKVEKSNEIIDNINVIARSLRNIVIDEDKGVQANELKRIADSRKRIGDIFDELNSPLKNLVTL